MKDELVKTIEQFNPAKTFAVGNDLVYVPDFCRSFNTLFRDKVYTESEKAYCGQFDNSVLRYASCWAAKEAVYKALKQVHNSPLGWKKIEIIHSKPGGIPKVNIHRHSTEFDISLTISHDGDYVWALAFVKIKINADDAALL